MVNALMVNALMVNAPIAYNTEAPAVHLDLAGASDVCYTKGSLAPAWTAWGQASGGVTAPPGAVFFGNHLRTHILYTTLAGLSSPTQ